ncbi:diiron oxygenase [Nocardia sp. NPDC057353]|uniref:AurF N-oxygenase family protein n=1 Tax=Nocardia sp. NPDC057353 TaxID=3346104 RepID=UPI00362834C3
MTSADSDALFEDLLSSAARLSFDARDPAIFAGAEHDDRSHGMSPRWSPLYDTAAWRALPPAQQVLLTRAEVAQFLGVAIWLELLLQSALLRRHVNVDPARPDTRFLLHECADENMHSLMFVNAVAGIGARFHRRDFSFTVFGWLFRYVAWREAVYGLVLAGEEIFDVMQRDWMADPEVAAAVRQTSYIHVVEESRHMQFARRNIRDQLAGRSRLRRRVCALIIAIGTHVIGKSLINRRVYEDIGLDWRTVRRAIDGNEHHRMMFRRAAEPLMDFLSREELLDRGSRWIYRKSNLL